MWLLRWRVGVAVLAAFGMHAPTVLCSEPDNPAGRVLFYQIADSEFDQYSKNPSPGLARWIREHYVRMQTYSPYFDSRLRWYPNAWVYKDSYAIKSHWSVYENHPEWVLRDQAGNQLYIPWGCSGGTCPQFAADVGNPGFRGWWIRGAAELLRDTGYVGIWVDDVNMAWRVSNGDGHHVKPVDPRTGTIMTLQDWRRYFAEFMEQIRASFPDAEIAHNAIWYAGSAANDDPYINRQIDAADYFNLERGISDRGLKGGGRFGIENFFAFVDHIHGRGRDVIIMDEAKTLSGREYGLAGWFLISQGDDLMSNTRLEWTGPESWWPGYELNLGAALGPRYAWRELIRRDFECGMVVLNKPGAPTRRIKLPEELTTIQRQTVGELELVASSAAILMTKRCNSAAAADDDLARTSHRGAR